MSKVGVFVCHCGTNIAAAVDVVRACEAAKSMPGVVHAAEYKYMCSEPGQQMILDAIKEYGLKRIVIASCSPRMHETTFRKMLKKSGVNEYLIEIANIREQVAWVHDDKEKATEKAIDLIRMAVAKVCRDEPLKSQMIPITKRALVIGGGIAGIQAALDIADAGHEVTLVEREPSIGGRMVMLDKTFPTLDCSACISTPKMVDVSAHPNIRLLAYSEVAKVEGYIGNFTVTIRQKARYVNHDICTGCGACSEKCPAKVPSAFNKGLSKRPAIYTLFPQAVPAKPVIDKDSCIKLKSGKCGVCEKICPLGCINYEDEDMEFTEDFGAIVTATGYQTADWAQMYDEYGAGRFPDVIDGLTFERLVNASGPTEGHIVRPSDGTEPKTISIIKCVGSRDPKKGRAYCSRACCMYAAKHARQIFGKIEGVRVFIFYIDVRTPGKGYEEFYDKTREDGAIYVRGRVSRIYKEGDTLICQAEDSLLGKQVRVKSDLVILETAMEPAEGSASVAGMLGAAVDGDGWLTEAHPKLRPVETQVGGVFLAGVCQGPKDIPDTVSQASAAAAKVIGLLNKNEMESSPMIASVEADKCSGCSACEAICPYKAITMGEQPGREAGGNSKKVMRPIAVVNAGLCQGCGACTVACRTGAIDLLGYRNRQILEEVDALWV
ncbi:MAG: CoB--CoM heterodisulfide reductase iron-sulfur subunit A family protein [Clostridiales Family XIII bacterium]|jgi:heterodisulfide reductase subunit A|nr:CoB--CoM heterodisulfide reductase iron-sulfur subunit A family protein [Clostridiales Family XIII bacterium]